MDASISPSDRRGLDQWISLSRLPFRSQKGGGGRGSNLAENMALTVCFQGGEDLCPDLFVVGHAFGVHFSQSGAGELQRGCVGLYEGLYLRLSL